MSDDHFSLIDTVLIIALYPCLTVSIGTHYFGGNYSDPIEESVSGQLH